MLTHCTNSNIDEAYIILKDLWDKGYSAHDIITNIFRVCKTHPMSEYLKLEFIKVCVFKLKIMYYWCTVKCTLSSLLGNWFHTHEDYSRCGIITAVIWATSTFVYEGSTSWSVKPPWWNTQLKQEFVHYHFHWFKTLI